MLFKLSNLNSNLALTLGYLNPALNNSAQAFTQNSKDLNMLHNCTKFAISSLITKTNVNRVYELNSF